MSIITVKTAAIETTKSVSLKRLELKCVHIVQYVVQGLVSMTRHEELMESQSNKKRI